MKSILIIVFSINEPALLIQQNHILWFYSSISIDACISFLNLSFVSFADIDNLHGQKE